MRQQRWLVVLTPLPYITLVTAQKAELVLTLPSAGDRGGNELEH